MRLVSGFRKTLATFMAFVVITAGGLGVTARKAYAYNSGVEAFVNSLYADCLGRTADSAGFNDWCTILTNGSVTGKQCAYGFFFSPEFQTKANAWSDDELISAYYRVFLNRTPDPNGLSYWRGQIANTTNDISILFTGFADSTEFAQKYNSYGITVGDHINVPTTTRGTASSNTATPTGGASGASGLAAQTNGTRANSVQELDAYWTSQGYEIMYIDLGNGATQKVYAHFYDMTDHNNQLNAWRNQNGLPSLTLITDPNDVRYQHARIRAVEVAYKFAHRRPCESDNYFIDPPGNEAAENISNGTSSANSIDIFRNSPMHNTSMLLPDINSFVTACCNVVFVNPDGITTTTTSPSTGTSRATVQLFYS